MIDQQRNPHPEPLPSEKLEKFPNGLCPYCKTGVFRGYDHKPTGGLWVFITEPPSNYVDEWIFSFYTCLGNGCSWFYIPKPVQNTRDDELSRTFKTKPRKAYTDFPPTTLRRQNHELPSNHFSNTFSFGCTSL